MEDAAAPSPALLCCDPKGLRRPAVSPLEEVQAVRLRFLERRGIMSVSFQDMSYAERAQVMASNMRAALARDPDAMPAALAQAVISAAERFANGGIDKSADMEGGDIPLASAAYVQAVMAAHRGGDHSQSKVVAPKIETNAAYFGDVSKIDKSRLGDLIDAVSDMIEGGEFRGVKFHGENGDKQTTSAAVYIGWLTAAKNAQPPAQFISAEA